MTPPHEFVFMDRAAIDLGPVFLHLKAEINWYCLFQELIDGFDVKAVEKRQAKAPAVGWELSHAEPRRTRRAVNSLVRIE